MKIKFLQKTAALAALLAVLGFLGENATAQQTAPSTARPDSLETARLQMRREAAKENRATKRAELQRRAEALRIPMQKTEGGQMFTLRRITPTGEAIYDAPDNLISLQTSCADSVKANGGLGLSLSGAGQTLGIWEAFEIGTGANVRTTHREFGGRATSVDGGTFSNHATHVAGTMIASGVDADAQGFSSAANLRCFNLTDDVDEMDDEANETVPIRVSNHSYGARSGWSPAGDGMWNWNGTAGAADDWKFGAYDDDAEDWDEVTFDNPFLTVFKAAGNDRGQGPANSPQAPPDGGADGFDCVPTSGNAKNIVTVGAIDDIPGGYTGPGSVQQIFTSFSAWGPTDDGRIKPDLVANGDWLYSSGRLADDDYDTLPGTSMATPSASGGAGLLLEHWQNVVGGAPRSATLKGLMIHQADEAGARVGPDYSNGWGLANIGDAAQLISIEGYDGCQQFVENSVDDGDVFNFDIQSSGTRPLKVTLTWTDPPASNTNNGTINPAGVRYLVNNLNLRVIQPGGGTALPWVLDPANPANAATTGDNNRDNVEQVLLLNPAAGTYTVRVVAPGSVEDGPQRFTLWFSGNDAVDLDKNIAARIYTGRETIAARRDIRFGPAVVVMPTANVRAFAGRSITLRPGFWAQRGGRFLAQIRPGGGCGDFSGVLKIDNYPAGTFAAGEPIEARNEPDDPQPSVALTGPTLFASPNPFSQSFRVQVVLPQDESAVSLHLLDARGQRLHAWHTETPLSAGGYTFEWAEANLPTGLYYVELRTSAHRSMHKMVKVSE
jgi:hypothetical protein